MVPVVPFEQRKLIPIYSRKWRKISYCSETAELAKIEQLIKKAYKMVQRSEPKIILTTNPGRALMTLDKTGLVVKIIYGSAIRTKNYFNY